MTAQLDVVLHPDAETELYECIKYYDSKVKGLGANFLNSLDSVVQRISTFPKSTIIVLAPDIRSAFLRKFSISIIYRTTPTSIQILALAHTYRQPLYWLPRASR